MSLSEERDRIQRQVQELEQSLSVTHQDLQLLSSETDDETGSDDTEDEPVAGLLAQKEKIQKEIQNLEHVLGPHSPVCVSEDDVSSSDESDLGLSLSVESCLQMNLVYQQVLQETLGQLETQLTHNHRQQRELVSQLSGPIKEPPREKPAPSSYQQPINMYLGRFLKPYFKDKQTGLGPPANQETKEKASRMTGCPDDRKLKMKRWESWHKTLLIHSVARDSLRRLIQPKLSKVDYLTQKLSSAGETDRQQLREQIDSLEREIDLLRGKKEEDLIADRYEEHDWQKISNIDFEGTRDAEDIRCFWQNFLHPSVNKTRWSQEEVQQLKDISRRHGNRDWEAITAALGTGRTAFMCLQTFQRFVSDSLRRSSWTPAEDALLRELVDKMRIGNFIPYTQMSYFMEGRDPAQLIYRWNQVLDPSLKKGPWTKQEDQLLLRAVSRHGEKNWWKIRLEVPGRTDSACRDRYNDCLKAGTKRGAFDSQERDLLLQLVEKHGVGRWAKIAAEIPNRYDAQCLREWRKLSRQQPPAAQRGNKAKKPQRSRGVEKKEKGSFPRRNVRRNLRKQEDEEEEEEEEEEESSEEEQEEMVVEYIDSDEEKKKEKEEGAEVVKIEEVQEEELEEYSVPPMKEWIPAEKSQHLTLLSFHPVALPPADVNHAEKPVRSTVVGKFGRSVIIGPNPRELRSEERYSRSAMMMVSPDQLRAVLLHQAQKCGSQSSQPHRRPQTSRRTHPGRVTDTGLCFELQAAVTPWIGNLLIPVETRRTAADVLRERGEKKRLSSTPFFLLLLQTMNVDTLGCKEVIELRKKKMVFLPTPPSPSSVRTKSPKTVAGILQQRKELQELELQHRLVLEQLHALNPQEKQKHQQLLSLQNRPGSLQMPPDVHPRMSPLLFPQTASIPHVVNAPPQTLVLVPPQQLSTSSLQIFSSLTTPPTPPQKPAPLGLSSSSSQAEGPLLAPPPAGGTTLAPPVPLPQTTTPSSSDRNVSTPSTSLSANRHTASISSLPSAFHNDHDYVDPQAGPAPPQPNPVHRKPDAARNAHPEPQPGRTKQGRREEQDGVAVGGGAAAEVIQVGKRVRKPSQKARALKETTKAKAEAKERRASSSPRKKRPRTSRPGEEVVTQPATRVPGMPGQSTLVRTPCGLVQLASAPPQGLQLAVVNAPLPPPPGRSSGHGPAESKSPSVSVPINLPSQRRPCPPPPLPACPSTSLPPTFVLRPVSSPESFPLLSHPPRPPPKFFLPYKGAVGADTAEPPPLRREALQFDPSLMFPEPREEVRDWLSGRGGVVVPGVGAALPYLPPFVSSLSSLGALLRAKKSLTRSSLQLLRRDSEAPAPQTGPGSDGSAETTPGQPPADSPDSTSEPRPVGDQPEAPSVSADLLQEEEEVVAAVRQLVTERFSSNPAYQLLKARFLSCFTVPALLATIQPVTEKTAARRAPEGGDEEEEDEEDEEEVELKKIQEKGRQRRAERSLLLCDGSGAPANHFSGILDTDAPTPDRTGPDR